MTLSKEVDYRADVELKINEDFLHRHNLQVTKHFENAPTLVWAIEPIDYPSHLKRPEPPIVLTSVVGDERDTVSIQVNRPFSEFTREQQILSVYYLGQLSYPQGPLRSVTLDMSLGSQTAHTIVDVLRYSIEGDFRQLINDISDEQGWYYVRFPQG